MQLSNSAQLSKMIKMQPRLRVASAVQEGKKKSREIKNKNIYICFNCLGFRFFGAFVQVNKHFGELELEASMIFEFFELTSCGRARHFSGHYFTA